jgi:hypothetical protein
VEPLGPIRKSVTVITTEVVLRVAGLLVVKEATDWFMEDWAGATVTFQWVSKLPVPLGAVWFPLEELELGVQETIPSGRHNSRAAPTRMRNIQNPLIGLDFIDSTSTMRLFLVPAGNRKKDSHPY